MCCIWFFFLSARLTQNYFDPNYVKVFHSGPISLISLREARLLPLHIPWSNCLWGWIHDPTKHTHIDTHTHNVCMHACMCIYINIYTHKHTLPATQISDRHAEHTHKHRQRQLPHPAFPSQAEMNRNPLDRLYISKKVAHSTSYT